MKRRTKPILLLFAVAALPAVAQQKPPIIDMHMHVKSVARGADGVPLPRPCNPRPCPGPRAKASTAEDVLNRTLEAMDRHNIVLAFLSEWPLENVYRWVDAAPGRLRRGWRRLMHCSTEATASPDRLLSSTT